LDEVIALQASPSDAKGHLNLALALLERGRTDEASAHFQKALELAPDKPQVLRTVAWTLATCPQASVRNGAKAARLAQRANDLTGGKNPVMLRALAAAFAEAGRFGDAMSAAQKALELARAAGQQDLAARLDGDLKRYREGLPLRP
jgi:spermidine synthase